LNIRSDDVDFTPLFLGQALVFKNGKLIIFGDEENGVTRYLLLIGHLFSL
jgi:hypothetical protein